LAIGLGVGGGIFLTILVSIGVYFFKRHKHTSILKISGSTSII
ncbi:10889_t:CDS:1, partial [Diversispora eburnea]